jgi:hypothetical protein
MADRYNFKVGDFVIMKSHETLPIQCVITKIGLTTANLKEYHLKHLYSNETYLCSVQDLILLMPEYDYKFEFDLSLDIPSTQELYEQRKAWHISTKNFLREQSVTQIQALVAKSEGEVAGCSHAEGSPSVDTPPVEPPSGFEGATQAIREEMDQPFDIDMPSVFEGATQAIREDLAKPFHFVDPFEGDTADILEELDKPFSID